MNERIIIRLTEDGKNLPINTLSDEGVTLRNETDATPRGLVIEFDQDSPVTKFRMERVRQLRGWDPFVFKLNVQLFDGKLVITGVDPRALPGGRYWFRLKIADLNLPQDRIQIEVPDDGDAKETEIKVKKDKRDVRLTSAVTAFDGDIKRVVEATASRLDGSAAADWLTSRPPRPRRKACFLNLLAKLRTAPTVSDHLLRNVNHVFFADVDRIYARVDGELFTRLDALARDPSKPFFDEGSPASAGHRRLLDRISPFEGNIDQYRLRSFRQEGRNSMQAVVAVPSDPTRRYYADLDIDLGNPLQDVVGFVIHMGELIDPGKTDHLALREKLGKNKTIAPFLFYEVVKNS
ncbi:MAG TPA: hypothetical protein VJ866_04820 [Pyrinomonadaceae bacterium]|nr:hypothetical protein [Pyrinomonadaceae bacterium]